MPRSIPTESTPDPLQRYQDKRDFTITAEPKAKRQKTGAQLSFVIQKHWASHLHYDFRLEHSGVLWSWALPKGPCFDPKTKRMAIHVEDHPVDYGSFEGTIPAKQYGAGTVMVWDRGTWEPVGDPVEGLKLGKILFKLHGEKLAGLWELVRISKPDSKQDQWMLFKKKDEWQRPLAEYDVISALPDSVLEKPLGLLEDRALPTGPTFSHSIGAKSTGAAGKADAAADLAGAVKAVLPDILAPQLATLHKDAPPSGDWLYEIKFDGYRIMARIEKGQVKLYTRNGHDWTAKMRPLADELAMLDVESAFLDGEAVVLDEDGKPNFSALQRAFDGSRTASIVYFVFDVPYASGQDLRQVPLVERKKILKQLLTEKAGNRVRYTEDFAGEGAEILRSACEMGLEGVIAKRRGATYVSDRGDSWLKLKCLGRQELVIVGFTDRANAPGEVGGLLLGYYDKGTLTYAGNVGTGWSSATSAALHQQLVALEVTTLSLDSSQIKPGRWSKRSAGQERWVRPELVAEIAFTEWTADGHVRHPSFKGLRLDKKAKQVTREIAMASKADPITPPPTSKSKGNSSKSQIGATAVTHGERVIDPSTGLTKLDLVRYYQSIAEFMLPHLANRPVSLVRAPAGVAGNQFFQKHDDKLSIPGMREFPEELWPEHGALLELPTADALISAAQMNVIEFHTWNATAKSIAKPDRMIFDLDPGEGVPWAHLQEAALLTRELLVQLELEAWLKTSGGKGLHVVVPLAPKLEFEIVKGFSQAVVQHLAKTIPSRFVAKSGPANRVGKIFIDWLRNGQSQTTAAAFSARARPGLGVSMPIDWQGLDQIKSGAEWTIATAREYLSFQKTDPWEKYFTSRQTLVKAIKMLGYVPKRAK